MFSWPIYSVFLTFQYWGTTAVALSQILYGQLGKTNKIWSKLTQKNRVFPLFWKMLSLIFAGNVLKWKLILSILLYKSQTRGSFCSWDIAGKVFNQLDCRILWSHISYGMTGSHRFFTCIHTKNALFCIFRKLYN